MSVITAVEGQTVALIEQFIDEFDDPLELANNEAGPLVRIYDDQKDLIIEAIAVPDPSGQPGDWSATISLPKMGLSDKKQFLASWSFRTSDGDIHRSKQALFVEPDSESRESDVVVIVGRDRTMQVLLPVQFTAPIDKREADVVNGLPAVPAVSGDSLIFHMYRNNEALFGEGLDVADPNSGIKLTVQMGKTVATLPAIVGKAKLEAILLLVEYRKFGMQMPTSFSYKVWPITPQVLVAASQMEDFINKARLANVIPELDYTQADLIQYLQRGLSLFNSLAPHTSNFDGTNMQGPILDAWLQCSAYYALAAQLQAEGALAFDFSGQSVSLNVDRTPSIESALGRIESAIEQNVKPFKKLLAKAGVLSGDGSAGGQNINGANHLGTLGLTNAPTTRHPYGGHRGSWFRPFY